MPRVPWREGLLRRDMMWGLWEPAGSERPRGVSGFLSVSAFLPCSQGFFSLGSCPCDPEADPEAGHPSDHVFHQCRTPPDLARRRPLRGSRGLLACPLLASLHFPAALILAPLPKSLVLLGLQEHSVSNPHCQEASVLPCSEDLSHRSFSSSSLSPFSASSPPPPPESPP